MLFQPRYKGGRTTCFFRCKQPTHDRTIFLWTSCGAAQEMLLTFSATMHDKSDVPTDLGPLQIWTINSPECPRSISTLSKWLGFTLFNSRLHQISSVPPSQTNANAQKGDKDQHRTACHQNIPKRPRSSKYPLGLSHPNVKCCACPVENVKSWSW